LGLFLENFFRTSKEIFLAALGNGPIPILLLPFLGLKWPEKANFWPFLGQKKRPRPGLWVGGWFWPGLGLCHGSGKNYLLNFVILISWASILHFFSDFSFSS